MAKNWKTSLFGALLGAGLLFGQGIAGKGPAVNTDNLVPAVAAIIAGLVQKDSDVTGGSRKQE